MANRKKPYKNNLQKYRVWKGLLQTDLAKATDISISEIRLIERNAVCPNPRTMKKLCDYFDVNFDQMFYIEEAQKNEI